MDSPTDEQPIVIRPARVEEVPVAASVLARSFADDELTRAMLGGPRDQVPLLTALLEGLLRHHHLPHGAVDVAVEQGRIAGVAAWVAPGQLHLSVRDRLRIARDVVPSLGWRLVPVLLQDRRDARVHPRTPHWYLHFIGAADPGKGIGGRLLDHGLARAGDAPCYLEASGPDSARLYSRKGFEQIGTVASPRGIAPQPQMWLSPGSRQR